MYIIMIEDDDGVWSLESSASCRYVTSCCVSEIRDVFTNVFAFVSVMRPSMDSWEMRPQNHVLHDFVPQRGQDKTVGLGRGVGNAVAATSPFVRVDIGKSR